MATNKSTFNINGVEYNAKAGMKSMIVFEYLTGEPFHITTTTDLITYLYACILSGTPGCRLDFEDFINAFDEDETLMKRMSDTLIPKTSLEKVVDMSNGEKDGGTEPKKD